MTFLASKVEESPRKLRDVILKGLSIRFKSDLFSESSPEYQNIYERILKLEKMALAVLCFDLTVDHPFRHLARLFNSHPNSKKREREGGREKSDLIFYFYFLLEFDASFTKHIWTILIESFHSPLPILFQPRVLAISILINEMSKRPEIFSERPINLPEFVGEAGDTWEKHFSKVPKEEVDKALQFLSTTK